MTEIIFLISIRYSIINNTKFVFAGGIGIVWFVAWLFLSYERPSHHPRISETEKKLIESKQGQTAVQYEVQLHSMYTTGFNMILLK